MTIVSTAKWCMGNKFECGTFVVPGGLALKGATYTLKLAPYSKLTGINSRLFGSGASYKGVGTVRKGFVNNNNYVRLGWTKSGNSNTFRLATGPNDARRAKLSKHNTARYVPHKHPFQKSWGWR